MKIMRPLSLGGGRLCQIPLENLSVIELIYAYDRLILEFICDSCSNYSHEQLVNVRHMAELSGGSYVNRQYSPFYVRLRLLLNSTA